MDAGGVPMGDAGGASVSFAPPDPSSKLLELERTLAAKDAVMEPGVMDSLRTYVASGGKPSSAIELLSENYRGYAQMSSLVCGWLELTEESEPSREHKQPKLLSPLSPVAHFGTQNDRGGDASAAATPRYYGDEDDNTPQGGTGTAARVDATPPKSSQGLNDNAQELTTALKGWHSRVRRDETFFLEQLIKKMFDPRKVDAVKGRPTWLTTLLNSEKGRNVLFTLAEKHPNCLLIQVAIQHAWSHGAKDSVKALGPAAASYFSIFHELLADHFRDLISAGSDEGKLKNAVKSIRNACCQSLATYLFAQMMLADLANGGEAGLGESNAECNDGEQNTNTSTSNSQSKALATRISQELQAAASTAHGAGVVRRITPLLCATDADALAATQVGELLQAADDSKRRRGQSLTGAFPQEMLKKLRGLYFDDEGMGGDGTVAMDTGSEGTVPAGKPSPVPIRSPELLTALFQEAFRWDPGVDINRSVKSREVCFDLIATATTASVEERDEALTALRTTHTSLASTARGTPPSLEEGSEFLQILGSSPTASAGALAWVKSSMGNPEHYKQVYAATNTAVYLQTVSEVAKKWEQLRGTCLEVITSALIAMGKGANEHTHLATLDTAVELVELGLVLPSLEAASSQWKTHIDPSHLRYFAGEVLEVAGPPYSGAFAAHALRLLHAANAGKGMTRAADEFVEQCRRQRARGALTPALDKNLDAFLERLAGVKK